MNEEVGSVLCLENISVRTSIEQLSIVVGKETLGLGITRDPIERNRLTETPQMNPNNEPSIRNGFNK